MQEEIKYLYKNNTWDLLKQQKIAIRCKCILKRKECKLEIKDARLVAKCFTQMQ